MNSSFWEIIDASHEIFGPKQTTQRARVPGGWLVSLTFRGGEKLTSADMVFISDPEYSWNLGNEKPVWKCFYNIRTPNFNQWTSRMKVPNGWIIMDFYQPSYSMTISMSYIQDTDHVWNISI